MSSGTATTRNGARKRQMVTLTLSPQARRALVRLARVIGSKSRAAEAAILAFDADTEPR